MSHVYSLRPEPQKWSVGCWAVCVQYMVVISHESERCDSQMTMMWGMTGIRSRK